MKFSDLAAFAYVLGLGVLLVVFQKEFIDLTTNHPYGMGFLKVSLLATFGECLKNRVNLGSWKISNPVGRFVVWGLFGFWFAAAFPFASLGLKSLISRGLWPDVHGIWLALSKSLWINVLGGYAFSMMVAHEYFNKAIEKGRLISFSVFAECMSVQGTGKIWFRFIPKTIFFFWVPAHTITFLLPGHYYVLFAATLSIVLGFIITIANK